MLQLPGLEYLNSIRSSLAHSLTMSAPMSAQSSLGSRPAQASMDTPVESICNSDVLTAPSSPPKQPKGPGLISLAENARRTP